MPKAEGFALGVIQIFVLLLPGAVFVALLAHGLVLYPFEDPGMLDGNEVERGFLLLAVAYVAGNLVSTVGAAIEDWVYDSKVVQTDQAHLRQPVRDAVQAVVGREIGEKENLRRWAATMVRLTHPQGAVDVERRDADRRFFRNMVVVFALGALGLPFSPHGSALIASAIICGALAVACAYRFSVEQRKYTQTVFEYALVVRALREPTGSRASVVQPVSVSPRGAEASAGS